MCIRDRFGAVERKDHEVLGEVGRFFFDQQDDYLRSKDPRRNSWKERKHLLRIMLWQKMLSWANHDVKIDRLYFQVNDRVKGVLQGYGLPLDQANARRVTQIIDGEPVSEWIFELDRPTMLLAEAKLMSRILHHYIVDLQKTAKADPTMDYRTVSFKFFRNEIWNLINMGLIQVTDQKSQPSANNRFAKIPKPFLFVTKSQLQTASALNLTLSYSDALLLDENLRPYL